MILVETLACVQLLSDIGHCLIKTFKNVGPILPYVQTCIMSNNLIRNFLTSLS